MGDIITNPKFTVYDANGDPLSGGLVYTYDVGTTDEKATYSDIDLSVANTNPVVLDTRGEAIIYGTGGYKIVVKSAAGDAIWTQDNVWSLLSATWTTVSIDDGDSPYTMPSTVSVIEVDCGSGSVELDLIDAADFEGKELIIKLIDATNALTVDPNGTQTIDGVSTSLVMSVQYETLVMYSDGSNWSKIYHYIPKNYSTIWIPAGAFIPNTTNGCDAPVFNEYDDIMQEYLAFDATTEQYAGASLVMPENWDLGTVKAKFYWSSAAESTAGDTVEWKLAIGAIRNNIAIDTALGTGQVISDILLADAGANLQITGATPSITVGGAPELNDLLRFKVSRNVGGTDDMTEDAWLFGVMVQYATNNLEAISGW